MTKHIYPRIRISEYISADGSAVEFGRGRATVIFPVREASQETSLMLRQPWGLLVECCAIQFLAEILLLNLSPAGFVHHSLIANYEEMMKRKTAAGLHACICSLGLLSGNAVADLTFAGISTWVGSGANESALVVDWNDGSPYTSDYKVWGYRWDTVDAPTGEDMLRDIAAADSDLYVLLFDFGGFGQSVEGIGYDVDSDGFSITPAVTFVDGVAQAPDSSTNETSNDADDLWNPGFDPGSGRFWNYYLSTSDPLNPETDWVSSGTGISGTNLSDGDWNGLSYATFGGAPPAAVPEPSTLALLASGLAAVTLRRLKHT